PGRQPFPSFAKILRPLTLMHLDLLRCAHSKFVQGWDPPELGDLLDAVLICSNDFESPQEYFAAAGDPQFLSDWGESLRPSLEIEYNEDPPIDAFVLSLKREIEAFKQYLKEGQSELWEPI